jgi:mono/diheme cytochrome c family protein
MKKIVIAGLAVAVLALLATAAPQGDGAALFKSKCAMCHGADGPGNTPMGLKQGAKDLKLATVQQQTDAQVAQSIEKGKGKMPGYEGKLKPEEVKQLVAFIRSLKK